MKALRNEEFKSHLPLVRCTSGEGETLCQYKGEQGSAKIADAKSNRGIP